MDKILSKLVRLDWQRIDVVEQVSSRALAEFTRPGALKELLAGVLTDQRLLGLSERHHWGDRIILWDDPNNQLRVRLHRFENRADEPHSHRWPFYTKVLHGSYRHTLYGPESWVRQTIERGNPLPRPVVSRTEVAGSSYAIDEEMVHNVKTEADTFTVIIQGPRLKEHQLRVHNGEIVWKGGRASESVDSVQSVLTTPDRLAEIAALAHNLGLIDSILV
ncbi:hypothetical protein ACFV42_35510 [Streptomyces solisilvae]|uniref:hypothetical protein n=1 Tax=Streptomyces malaysiensis TaxID=92644 RepID=UPI003699821B